MKASLVVILILFWFNIQAALAQKQHRVTDLSLARKYYNQALILQKKGKYSDCIVLYDKASVLYQKNQQWSRKIDCDNEVSSCLISLGKYNEAIDKAKATLQENFTKLKGDSTRALSSYINIGNVLLVKAKYDKAMVYQQRALKIRLSAFGQNHPDVADSYTLIANIFFAKGKYPKSLEYHQKALQIRRATLNENHIGMANSYHYIGNIYFITGQYDKGLEYHLKALQIRRNALGDNHKDVANSYNGVANNYHYKGEYNKALENQLKALKIRLSLFGENHPSVAGSYNNIGNIYYVTGEYEKALEYHELALKIKRSVFGEKHLDVADSYHIFGNIYSDKGEYDKALDYFQKALQIRSAISPETHPGIASSHQTIGSIYLIKGEPDKALEYHQKALQIRLLSIGESHPHVANSYSDIGNVYEAKRDYAKALEYHQKALQIKRSGLGEKHPSVANSYYNLGNVHQMFGDYEKGLEYHQLALQIRRSVFDKNHPSVGDSYNQLGILYLAKKDYEKATEYHNKSLQNFLKTFGKTHPSVADCYNQLGKVYYQTGKYQKSLQLFQQAIIANVPSFQDTLIAHNPKISGQANLYLISKTLLVSLRIKAKVLEMLFNQSHQTTDLLLAYQTSCSADSLANKIQLNQENETDKVAFTASTVELYQQALPLCLKLYHLTQEQNYLDKAFYFAERGKSSVLLSSLVESKAKIFAGIPDSLLQQDQNLRNQIAQYTQRLAKELNKGVAADSNKLLDFQNQLFKVNRQKEKLVSQFEKFYPRYYDLKYQAAIVTVQQLQRKLNKRTVVLEYVVGPNALQVFLLGHNFFEVKSIPLDSLFERQLDAFRDGIILKDMDLYQQVAYKLYKLLLPPNIPPTTKSLIIIPDGKLNSIPFEALLTQDRKVKNKKSGAYLLHKYNISYAYSGRLLYDRLMLPTETSPQNLLALAPIFADSATNHKLSADRIKILNEKLLSPRNTKPTPTNKNASSKLTSKSFGKLDTHIVETHHSEIEKEITRSSQVVDGQPITPLLASEREVKTIAQLFRAKGAKAQVYLYNKATEDQMKSMEASRYNYIHLATHGLVNENFPELSGLMLSQENTGQEDGILYTGEIYNLGLKADLVTLSACETGLGKLAQGEGVIGITRALLFAGAKNVLVSLWKVSDESTAELMKYFYQALLSGKSKTKALQIAQRKLVRKGQYSSPFYWAPFILIGR